MIENIVALLLGFIFIIIGISNIKGNVSLLHSYHRRNVSKADEGLFGRKVGTGIIIIGSTIIISSCLSIAKMITDIQLLETITNVCLAIGMVTGLSCCFYAIKKYNKSIF